MTSNLQLLCSNLFMFYFYFYKQRASLRSYAPPKKKGRTVDTMKNGMSFPVSFIRGVKSIFDMPDPPLSLSLSLSLSLTTTAFNFDGLQPL